MVRLDTVVLGGATYSDSLLCSPTRLVVTLTPGEKLIIVWLWYLGSQISQLDFTPVTLLSSPEDKLRGANIVSELTGDLN